MRVHIKIVPHEKLNINISVFGDDCETDYFKKENSSL